MDLRLSCFEKKLLLLLLKIFKEGGPSAAAVFQEALHLNT